MKRTYLILVLIALLCSVNSFSQITVTSTAGITAPTSYTTLKAAFDAINAGMHQGNVGISITASTIEPGVDSLVASGTGAASYSAVNIKPAAGVNATITGSVPTALIKLNGADYVTIEGSNNGSSSKNLTIENTNPNGNTLVLTNSTTYAYIRNVIFKGASQTSSVILIGTASPTEAEGNKQNRLTFNDITRSASGAPAGGVSIIGTPGKPNIINLIEFNNIYDFTSYGISEGVMGVANSGFNSQSVLEFNKIYQTSASTGSLTGIFIADSVGYGKGLSIKRNYIYDLNTTVTGTNTEVIGIHLKSADSIHVNINFVAINNSSTSAIGILDLLEAGSKIVLYYNTISLSGSPSNASTSYAFLKDGNGTNSQVVNNIFTNARINPGSGKQYAIGNNITPGKAGTMVSNNNDLVSTGNSNNLVGRNYSSDLATLGNWQSSTNLDLNSVSIVPVFVSPVLPFISQASNPTLDNKGVFVNGIGIGTDIDGDNRDMVTPDVGADEFGSTYNCAMPAITTQPLVQSACLGGTASFSVTATGSGLTYQWRKNGVNITGATSSTYSKPSLVTTDAGNYDVVVKSGQCALASNAVSLTVNQITITSQPAPVTTCAGVQVTFTVTATGSGTLAYQWRKNGVNIPGATGASYTIPSTAVADAGNYELVVSIGGCSVTSTAVMLTVKAATVITNQPSAVTSCQGNAQFTVTASGSNLNYQWTLDGNPINGATSANLSIPINASISPGAHQVAVTVTGDCGTVNSNHAVLTVQNCTSVPDVNADLFGITMKPNLVNEVAKVQVTASRDMQFRWHVIDASGRVVLNFRSNVTRGNNEIDINLAGFSGGAYVLQVVTGGRVVRVLRFVRL